MKTLLVALGCTVLALGCGSTPAKISEGNKPVNGAKPVKASTNPLLIEFDTPFGVPPFAQITDDHFAPAFEEAMALHRAEISAIADNTEPPVFDNTVAALDYSGRLLSRVEAMFFNKNGADTNEQIQRIAKEVAPKLSAHHDEIMMNAKLFSRVKVVHEARDTLGLNGEQRRLLEETYREFVRGGAELDEKAKARLTAINKRLALLQLQFGDNLLAENNTFKLVIEKKEELAGLPKSSIAAAAKAAKEAGHDGKWVFTLHKPSWIPFLQFSERRDYRERMFTGYVERGNNGDERDNKAILTELVKLRIEHAKLLGHPTHAHYVLEQSMAKTPDKVYQLLNRLWKAALPVTKAEAAALQAMLARDIPGAKLQPWDWWYYTEKLRKKKYDLSDAELRPYFSLNRVQQGAFEVCTKLYGLKFIERKDLPVYHRDVKVVQVQEADGTHVGVLYLDYHPRKSKKQGAWMTEYRGQKRRNGKLITPVVANVFNFSQATTDAPALLSFEEVETLFHELGHGLHGLLSNVTYPGLAGTSVPRDFVELPSQIMENWAVEPSVMKSYARHYKTGEPIPDELVAKIRKARHFNQGFGTTEYLAASFLDLGWHTLKKDPGAVDVVAFEKKTLDDLGLIPQIAPRYRSGYFAHIFAGGYSAGYYSYIWAAVLDSDAFAAFKEKKDLFEPTTARALRRLLASGNTVEPMKLYVQFRGAEPKIEPLLGKRGLATGR